jgi:hypothetical protein
MPEGIRKSQFSIHNDVSRLTFHFSLFPLSSFLSPPFPLFALTLLAVWPLLSGGLPTVGDGLNHFHRFAQLDWHLRHGDFYPRWFVNLHYGFGAPVLNFYAPLAYYLPLLFRLFNLPLPTCLLLGYVLAFGAAIFGTYYWAINLFASPRQLTAQPPKQSVNLPGLIASAAFALSPYFYLNALHRGAYPELWALALAPWLFWSAHRLVAGEANWRLALQLALIHAALTLTHTLSALLFTPLVVIYGLVLSLGARQKQQPLRPLGFWLLGFGISIALTAFFTLPVLIESKDIQLFRAFLPGDLDYRNNFLGLSSLLSPPANFDPALVFNAMPASLPWPQLILVGVVGVLMIKDWRLKIDRSLFIIHCSLFISLSVLTLSASQPIWDTLPLARFIQFPWRLVGPASLFLAALAGQAFARFSRLTFAVSLLAIASFFFFSLSWTYHSNFQPQPANVTPAEAVAYETASGHLGATSAGEYLPRWVEQLPDLQTVVFSQADLPSRLAPLPSTMRRYTVRTTIYAEELDYDSPTPFTLTLNRFYFPGWAASVDGAEVNVTPSTPGGLLTAPAPAGKHTIRLELRPTAPQLAGAVISFATVFIIVSVSILSIFRLSPPAIRDRRYTIRHSAIASLFIISLLISRIVYFDRIETPFHYTRLHSLPNPVFVNFEDQLELIGYEYNGALTSGGQLPITIYWRALVPLAADYSTTIQLVDRFGNRFGASDSQHPGRVPTSRWTLDQYARDEHSLVSLAGTPPGEYHLRVGAYADQPLSVIEEGAPVGVEYDLGVVMVERADPQPPGPLTLVESKLAADSVMVGDQLSFTLLWNSGEKPLPVLTSRLLLTDVTGQTIFSGDLPPAGEDYTSSQWAPNELIRYPFSVALPPDLPGGLARVSLLLLAANGVIWAGPFDLGSITIVVPERSFTIPPMAHRVDHDFGDAIRLLGYDLNSDSITLYWQSLRAVAQRLIVFVHRLDESGAFVAGHDSAPARATTGWLPGEVIMDVHPLSVGDHFEVGLYDLRTGERYGEIFVEKFVTSP